MDDFALVNFCLHSLFLVITNYNFAYNILVCISFIEAFTAKSVNHATIPQNPASGCHISANKAFGGQLKYAQINCVYIVSSGKFALHLFPQLYVSVIEYSRNVI